MPRAHKILIVDDMKDVRNTLAGTLADLGYLVRTADNEELALNAVAGDDFDFIVVDIRLRGHSDDDESGMELAKEIRKRNVTSQIIFITGQVVRGMHFDVAKKYDILKYVEKCDGWVELIIKTIEDTVVLGRQDPLFFHVFLCHNSKDKPQVKEIGNQLIQHNIRPWLDEWELRPGLPWQRILESEIENIPAAAVFVGMEGIGPWQQMEMEAFLRKFVERDPPCPVIPVVLPTCEKTPELPPFLSGMTWVDFRKPEPDPMRQLIWGITGKKY